MNGMLFFSVWTFSHILFSNAMDKPNIIFILADDMGWNDVSYNGMNEILTPNIDSLGADGVFLHQYYTEAVCTPSRSALMSGLYPIRTGLQSLPMLSGQPKGLPLQLTTLPQHLKRLGYTTRAVGKWHLGHETKNYTPIYRGFDSHFGYWGGVVDYFQYTGPSTVKPSNSFNNPTSNGNDTLIFTGYDMRDNMKPVEGLAPKYLPTVLTERAVDIIRKHNQKNPLFLYLAHISPHSAPETVPLRAPKRLAARFSYITNKARRNFAGVLTELDESVGEVMEALLEASMLNNTLVVFSSDNGGGNTIMPNGGSNYPLRGTKISCFEGGIRVPGLVWSPLLKNRSRVSNELFHITDWLPTFYRAGGGDVRDLGQIDGIDQWETLTDGKPSDRSEFLVNVDPNFKTSGMRVGNYKLIYGRNRALNIENWFGPTGRLANPPGNVWYDNKVKRVLKRFHRRCNLNLTPKVKSVDCGGSPPPYSATECIEKPCLFDMINDPCEYTDVSHRYPQKTQEIFDKLKKYIAETLPIQPRLMDYNSDPMRHCGLWTTWNDPDPFNSTCSTFSSF